MLQPLIQGGFQVANALFLRSVVAGKVRRVVQWQHAEAGHDGIHMLIIEGRAVVAFEEQWCAVLPEQAFEMGGDLPAIEPVTDQRPEPVA